jgi:DNA-binding CsgD family transcriptional regulator
VVIGREVEVAAVERLVAGAGAGFLALEGEPGIGKSTLWEHGIALAAERAMPVLQARASEAETGLSFAAVTDLLDGVLDGILPALAPPRARALEAALLRSDVGAADSRAIALGVVDALSALNSDTPVVVAIDDWQWLDSASSLALSFAARRLVGSSVRFLCTARPADGGMPGCPIVRELRDDAGKRMVLDAFTPSELHQLMRERCDLTPSRPALLRLHRETGGNPYIALEVVRAVMEEGGDLSAPGPLPVPADVHALLRRRVDSASEEVRELLAFAALLGEPTLADIEAAASDRATAREDIADAARQDLLVVEAERVRFSHPLLASAVRSRLGADEARRLHQRLADAVSDPERQALHLALATDTPDERIAATLEKAAAIAARRAAHPRAAELYHHAARLTEPEHEEWLVRRTLAASEQHYVGGDGRAAASLLKNLIEQLPRGPNRGAALEALANVEVSDSLISYYEQALDEIGDDPRRRAGIHLGMGMALGTKGDFDGWMGNLRQALRFAREAGDHALAAAVLTELGLVRFSNGEGPQRELYEEALREQAIAESPHPTALRPEWSLGCQLVQAGDPDAAAPLLAEALALSRETGGAEAEMGALMLLAHANLETGDWPLADAYSAEALELAEQIQISNGEGQCLFHRSIVQAHMGLLDEAWAHASRGAALAREIGDLAFTVANDSVLGFIALMRNELPTAAELLGPLPDHVRALGMRSPQHFPVRDLAAEALVLTGDLERAALEIDELDQMATRAGHDWGRGSAARCRALLLSTRGEAPDALASSARAVELHEGLHLPFELARSLLVKGSMQRRAKLKRPARETLERAAEIFQGLGSPVWLERTRAELARIGGRRAGSDVELTATEQRVADLAAAGRTNKQIARELYVSERTVEANLTKVYRKLGLRSRTELASQLREPAATDA